jgi:diguanylate cyclase (GGDEF)-like protein/PAS domain S-box-containing protein
MPNLHDPEIFRTVLDSLQTGVSVVDRDGKILFWNQGAETITGHKRHDVVGRSGHDSILNHCDGEGCVACGADCPFSRTMQDGKPKEARMQLRHKQGHPIHVLMRVAPIRDQRGSIIGLAENFDEQRFASDRDRNLRHLSAHGCMDEVTGVPNREFTEFHLRENLASFTRYQLPFGVMYIQIDQLGQFRAAYGKPAGEAILRLVAQTMRNSLRPSDFLGRWTEDQFLAILVNCGTAGVEKTGERMRKVVSCAGLHWWGDKLSVTTSVGEAIAQTDDTIDSLLSRAELSLKQFALERSAAVAASGSRTS